MNPKIIATAAIFSGIGGLVGWAVTADSVDAKLKQAELDVEQMSDMVRRKTRQIIALQSELDEINEVIRDIPTAQAAAEEEAPVFPEGETPEETRSNLQTIIDEYTNNPQDRDTFVERGARVIEGADRTPPFVISRELYAHDEEEGDDYAKITLFWYPKDRVLLDDEKDIIPAGDVDYTVGWKNLNQFGGESGDPNVVFIRNRRLLTDYEVVNEEDDELPAHIRYGMGHEEYETNKAAGRLVYREDDV